MLIHHLYLNCTTFAAARWLHGMWGGITDRASGALLRRYPSHSSQHSRAFDKVPGHGHYPEVNIAQIDEAIHRGVRFRIKVADGDEYSVAHPDYVFVPPKTAAKRTYIVIHNDEGFASILPLLTITSLTCQVQEP